MPSTSFIMLGKDDLNAKRQAEGKWLVISNVCSLIAADTMPSIAVYFSVVAGFFLFLMSNSSKEYSTIVVISPTPTFKSPKAIGQRKQCYRSHNPYSYMGVGTVLPMCNAPSHTRKHTFFRNNLRQNTCSRYWLGTTNTSNNLYNVATFLFFEFRSP